MEANDYQAQASQTRMPMLRSEQLVLGALGLVREASEAAEHVERELFFQTPIDPEKVKSELGDTMWYLCLLCDALDISLEDVLAFNLEKLARRYPSGHFDINDWRARHAKENGHGNVYTGSADPAAYSSGD